MILIENLHDFLIGMIEKHDQDVFVVDLAKHYELLHFYTLHHNEVYYT